MIAAGNNVVPDPDRPKRGSGWTKVEIASLVIGLGGAATACLANYGWHWFKESQFYMIWSAAPFGLLLLGSYIARRLIKSPVLRPITALFAVVMTAQSLMSYITAVLKPHHSSGIVFAALPLCWMIAIPVVLTLIVVGFLAADRLKRSRKVFR